MAFIYRAVENLKNHNALLHDTVALDSGVQLAAWSNKYDKVT